MTVIETATPECAGHSGLARGAVGADRARSWTASRGIPATRELELTLWSLLAVAGVAIAAGAIVRPHPVARPAFVLALIALLGAAALLQTVAALTPAALRLRRPWRRWDIRVAVVGTAASALDLAADLEAGGARGVHVLGAISPKGRAEADGVALGVLDDVRRIVHGHRIDVVLVGPDVARHHVLDVVMRTCEGSPVRVCDLTEFYEEEFGHVPITDVDSAWFEHLLHPRFGERVSQRIVDVIAAAALLLVFLPALCAAALLIRRDGGPALFRQVRVGRDGRPFVMYKLRTMGHGEASGGWTLEGDPRLTQIGRILRRLHADELPQLVSVLRGDMTLVGPRPEQPDVVAGLEPALPLWRGRHRYKPGLTGWAQVRCGYAGSHDGSARKLAHDLYYLRHHSLAFDAAILLQTARQLFAPRGETVAPVPFLARSRDRVDDAPEAAPAPVRHGRFRPSRSRAIVTGGAGFIGSQLVDRLIDEEYDVVVVDDLSAGRPGNLAQALTAGARLEQVDVTSTDEMRRVCVSVRPHVIFHLAAQIEVSRAVEEPLVDAKANVVGTLSVLEAARACSADRFVLASSGGAIYGDAAVLPTAEDAALTPLSPYGTAKLAAEQYAALYNDLYGLSTVSLRLANVYGPRQGLSGEGGVIARYCRARVNGVPAQVFGDGLQTRDYVHVRDVVSAFVAAGRGAAAGAFNIGTGTETTLIALLETLGLEATFRAPRSGDVRRSSLDATAALRHLGWRALMPLEEGLADTLAFAREAGTAERIAV